MLIVSKFHDYYDRSIGFGIDKTCVYKRETRELSKAGTRIAQHTLLPRNARYQLFDVVIGFCGSLYPVVLVEGQKTTNPLHLFYTPDNRFLYSVDELREFD